MDQKGALILNAVGAGLVHGFAGIDVGAENLVREAVKHNLRSPDVDLVDGGRLGKNGKAGQYPVGAALELLEGVQGFLARAWLAKNDFSGNDHGVGPEHHGLRAFVRNLSRLAGGHAADKGLGSFAGLRSFVNVRRRDFKFQTEPLKKFLPARRG